MQYQVRQFMYRRGWDDHPAVRLLLGANVAVGLLTWLMPGPWRMAVGEVLALSWYGLSHGWVWQLITYMFLHASGGHLLMNMLGLWMLGPMLEHRMGTRAFLVLYFLSGILGGVGFVLIDPAVSCVGASGAVFGILGAFAALFPHQPMTLLFFPIASLPAWQMVLMFGIVELLYLGGGAGGIAHSAHLAGGLAGYVLARFSARGVGGWPRTWSWRGKRAPRDERSEAEFRRDEEAIVNGILDKISQEGPQSLTQRERAILERASRERGGLR